MTSGHQLTTCTETVTLPLVFVHMRIYGMHKLRTGHSHRPHYLLLIFLSLSFVVKTVEVVISAEGYCPGDDIQDSIFTWTSLCVDHLIQAIINISIVIDPRVSSLSLTDN